jgi:FAD dependent oxidoreductase
MSSGTRIVICGGGAIGAAIAYFTSRRGARSTVIERYTVAGAASGKSGGFLALDWCRGSSLDSHGDDVKGAHARIEALCRNISPQSDNTSYLSFIAPDRRESSPATTTASRCSNTASAQRTPRVSYAFDLIDASLPANSALMGQQLLSFHNASQTAIASST